MNIQEKINFKDLTNYKKLLITAEQLRYSQGFYSRLYQNLIELEESEIEDINSLENFKNCQSTLDVILELEQ